MKDELTEARNEIDRWKKIASYLAECHAATLAGAPKRTAQYERRRLSKICLEAQRYLGGVDMPPMHWSMKDSGIPRAIEWCQRVVLEYGPK